MRERGGMKSLALLVAAGLTGCAFVPRNTVSKKVVGSNVALSATVAPPGQAQGLTVHAQARNGTLRIVTTLRRTCQRTLVEQLEVTHGKRWGFWVANDSSGYSLVIGFMLAPILLPVSATITGITVANHDDRITREERATPNGIEPCPLPSRMLVKLTLPSGGVADVITDGEGVALFELPAEEPDQGTVIARADQHAARVDYYRTHEACEASRLTMLDRANAAPARRVVALQAIPRCASMTTGTDPRGDRAWELAMAAAIGAASGRCQPAFQHEAELKQLDLPLHTAVYGHADIVGCFGRDGEHRRVMSECQIKRAEAMRAAQLIQDPNRRGEALRKVPRCD